MTGVQTCALPISSNAQLQTLDAARAGFDPLNIAPDGTVTAAARKYSYKKMTISDNDGVQQLPKLTAPADTFELYAMFNQNGEIVDMVKVDPIGTDPRAAAAPPTSTLGDTLVIQIPGAADITFPIDRSMFFANGDVDDTRIFTQVSKESDAKGVQLKGISAGSIDTFNISSKGEIIGIYTNGERKVLQTIGLVDFDNPAGLMKIGGNLFQNTPNSGTPKYGAPGTGSFGSITPGALEMSNVDLAAQFTDMITTQRGFQANSRVITTSDEILQELVNLKR